MHRMIFALVVILRHQIGNGIEILHLADIDAGRELDVEAPDPPVVR